MIASALNAAATTDGVKTSTTAKISKKVVGYSKMNYNQLYDTYRKIQLDNIKYNNTASITGNILDKTTYKNYKQLQIMLDKYFKK